MAVDISHLNEAGADELMDGPVAPIASHSCAKALCDHPRNLSDRQLRKLFRVGGHIGVNFYPGFLDPSETADIDKVIDHIAYMCDLGGENFVGFGSDFDGIERHPAGLRGNGDFANLIDRMRRRRFDEILVQKIAGLNFRQYMDRIDQSTEI
jgi:Zn-dependent dipeptidase, microsomal dipeptidase homolog